MIENKVINTYSPNNLYRQGLLKIFKKMVVNIIDSRELIWQLFIRDFKARYKQSLLGWIWVFLMPIVTMGTFLLLNISGIIKIGDIPVPYPIFGLLGFSIWQIFSNGWLVLTSSIDSAGTLVSQISFPKEALIVAAISEVVVDFLIRLVLVLVVYLIYGLSPSFSFFLLPFFLLPIFLLTLGLGFVTSILAVVIRDIKNFINVGMSFFLFLMPIMYTIPEKGFLAKVNHYNPIFFLVSAPRDIIISGKIEFPIEFLLSSILALIVFIFGWLFFYISQPKITERI
ncbi:hypothetical protein COT75_01595 [Candidatus Beckwithbacteria bacterium CG10_big_fil_rev_8_21_14_0_10_34_10]|uniref:ABC-2 type transporter transmembrane domain-containing protein n=1 Tax=Candidatus Beckwithbacteria bacterium CG10_big_fil_rev_8_21_14_0_10_34_10 TaxID=1974495 RepID=A0A2H0W9L7_9BACT|nr:MAG: hypothetical protein COT75_01595 [Candidatus Beckwithbacteria bacterium CG10_big_fil_rev_8_21_14_0_10_34_10]